MKKLTQTGAWLALTLLAGNSPAAETNVAATPLSQVVNDVLQTQCLDPQQTAISIVGAPDGGAVYAHNTDSSLLPASVVKIITTAAALHYLGPEYRFHTDLLYSGQRVGDTLQGDLIIRGGGDPRLVLAEVMQIAHYLKNSGIRQVSGNLVADTGFFDAYDRAPAWSENRSQRAHDAKLGALSVNYNIVSVHVLPGEQAGDAVRAWMEPAPAYLRLFNSAVTETKGNSTVWAQRGQNGDQPQIDLRGRYPLSAGELVAKVNIDDPVRFAAETFRSVFEEHGVRIAGYTATGPTPSGASLLYRHSSPPLSVILKELNTYSNNFVAEQILKTMAAEHFGVPGSHANGLALVYDFLKHSGVNTEGVVLMDASGLSRQNRFTAAAMTELLTAVLSRFDIAPDFMASLRVMGANGLHSNRLANSPARAQIRAKTGSLYKVSNLAGYVAGSEGRLYAYALFFNNNECGGKWADALEDKIITAIYQLDRHHPEGTVLSGVWGKSPKAAAN